MLAYGVLFEEERTTFADLAFHLYQQVNTGQVALQNYRFVSVITQWLPVQLLNGGVEMKIVQLVYSLVFPVFYGTVWAVTHFVLKAKFWALAWTLMWLSFATHTHFWIQSELPQGLAILVLALGLISYKTEKDWTPLLIKIALSILLITVAFAHPLLIVPVTFSLGFLWLLKRVNRATIRFSATIYMIALILKTVAFWSPYDKSAGGGIKTGLTSILNLELPYSIPHFVENLGTSYYAFSILTLLGIWLLWKSGNRLSAAWVFVSVIGYIGIVSLVHSTSATPDFYFENLCLPAAFMAAAGLAVGIERTKIKMISPILSTIFVLFIIFRLNHVAWIGNEVYTTRLAFLKEMVYRHAGKKVIYQETPELLDSLIITWGTGYEAWLLSARNKSPTHCFLVSDQPAELQWAVDDPTRLILQFHQPLFSELSKQYFEQPNDKIKYKIID